MPDTQIDEAADALKHGTEEGRNDKDVKKFGRLISDYQTTYRSHFSVCDLIQRELIDTYSVKDPTLTPRKLTGWILQQALFKTKRQFKTLDFTLFSAQADEDERIIMQALTADALEKAGYHRCESIDFGSVDRQLTWGDAAKGFGPTPLSRFPFGYWVQDFSRVCFDLPANIIRNPGSERETRKMVILKDYPAEVALNAYPQIRGKATLGTIPEYDDSGKMKDMTQMQDDLTKKNRIQFAFCLDLDKRLYMIMVGGRAWPMLKVEGGDFPFVDEVGDEYLNLTHKICYPNPEGMPNFGLGHLLYRLNILERVLVNKGALYTIDNSNPLRVVSVASGKEKDFTRQVKKARRAQRKGEIGVIWNKDGKDFGGVSTMRTEAIIGEMNDLLDVINSKIIMPFGINLQDVGTDPQKTFGAIESEIEAASEGVQELQRRNAPETKFEITMMMDYCKKHVRDDNPIPLRAKKPIKSEETGKPIEVNAPPGADYFTLGDYAKSLQAKLWEVEINAESGVKNSRMLDISRGERLLNRLMPGTKAWAEEMKAMAAHSGRSYEDEDFIPQQQEQAEPKVLAKPFA
jgi:hypothetical protein